MPDETYTWRPGEGVRSVGEVFARITIAAREWRRPAWTEAFNQPQQKPAEKP